MLTPQSLRSATLFLVTPLAPLGKPNLASDQHAVIKKRFGRWRTVGRVELHGEVIRIPVQPSIIQSFVGSGNFPKKNN